MYGWIFIGMAQHVILHFCQKSAVSPCWWKRSYKSEHSICKLLTKSHLGSAGVVRSHSVMAVSTAILTGLTTGLTFDISLLTARALWLFTTRHQPNDSWWAIYLYNFFYTQHSEADYFNSCMFRCVYLSKTITLKHRFTLGNSSERFPLGVCLTLN